MPNRTIARLDFTVHDGEHEYTYERYVVSNSDEMVVRIREYADAHLNDFFGEDTVTDDVRGDVRWDSDQSRCVEYDGFCFVMDLSAFDLDTAKEVDVKLQ